MVSPSRVLLPTSMRVISLRAENFQAFRNRLSSRLRTRVGSAMASRFGAIRTCATRSGVASMSWAAISLAISLTLTTRSCMGNWFRRDMCKSASISAPMRWPAVTIRLTRSRLSAPSSLACSRISSWLNPTMTRTGERRSCATE
ncbi:hypothetical protein D9M68_820220 [compost metagenome]